jgi:hypothetical protein
MKKISQKEKSVKKKPFDFAKRSKANLALLSGKTADGKRVKPRIRKTIENDETCLQKHCWQWVQKAHSDLLIFHVANERKGSIGAVMHFKRMGVLPGVADFLAFPYGRSVAIELKDDEGAMDLEQQKFARRWEGAGNAYFVVRTIEEFQGVIDAITLF